MGIPQSAVVIEHAGLVIQQLPYQAMPRIILKWDIGQKVNQRRHCHEKNQAETDSLPKLRKESPNNLLVGNPIRTAILMPHRIIVLPETLPHGEEKNQAQSEGCIDARPLAGPAKSHSNSAKPQRNPSLLQIRIVKALPHIAIHEIVRQDNKERDKHINRGNPGLGKMHEVKGKKHRGNTTEPCLTQ